MNTRRIGFAALIWSAGLLLSRVIGLIRERALGATLGVSGEADVYQAAFRIPDLVYYLLAGGALSIVFIPLVTAHIERGDEARAWRSFSVIANFIIVLMAVLVPVLWVAMPYLVPLLAPGFDAERLTLLTRLSRIILPAMVFHLLGALCNAALLARDKHAIPAFSPLLYNVGIIAGGYLTGTAEGFAWGVLGGAAIGVFGLPLISCLRIGLSWQPVLSLVDTDFRAWLARSIPIMLGWSIVGMDDTIVTWFSSSLPAGEVALLGYAKTLMRVPMGVFGFAMGYAAYPTITRLCAEGKTHEAYQTLTTATRRVLVLAFGSQVVLTVAGTELAELVYTTRRIPVERMEDLGIYLGCYGLALGAWSAQAILPRGFYARGKTWLPTWLGTGVMVLSLPLFSFMTRYGGAGLAVAASVAVTVYIVLLEVMLRREIGHGPGYMGLLGRVIPSTAIAIAVGLLLRGEVGGGPLVAAMVLSAVSGTVYLAFLLLLRTPEATELLALVQKRVSRRR